MIDPSPAATPDRIRHAKLTGAAMAVRDAVMLASPEVAAAQRKPMPRVWKNFDRLFELAVEG